MPKQTEPPAPTVRLTTNCILNGRFFNRGEPLPVASVADLPPNLQKVVAITEPEAEEPNEPRGSFQTGVIYEMTDDGRIGRALRRNVQRQVAELEAAAQEDDWIEEQLDAPLPPEIAQGLQEEHENSVAFAKAQLAADANRSDEASDAAAAAAEPPRMYVKRGSRHYAPAHKARLKPGEPVFVRQPESHFECIGTTDGNAELPDLPITL
jgi:hypothetical protein